MNFRIANYNRILLIKKAHDVIGNMLLSISASINLSTYDYVLNARI